MTDRKLSKVCRLCLKEKPIDDFKIEKANSDQHNNACKSCKNLKDFEKIHSCTESFLKNILKNTKDTAKKEALKNNDESYLDILTITDLKMILKDQDGSCFYSGIKMNIDKNTWKMSIARIDESKRFSKENTILCCIELNKGVKWSHEKINHLLERSKGDGEMIPLYKFDINSHKKYKNGNDKSRIVSPRTHMQRLISNAQATTKKKEKLKPLQGEFEIDIDDLSDQYTSQNGRCAYSKMPLEFKTKINQDTMDWLCALERKNMDIGYTRDNVILVCEEFSSYDYQVRNANQNSIDDSSSRWSEEKFNELFEGFVKKKG